MTCHVPRLMSNTTVKPKPCIDSLCVGERVREGEGGEEREEREKREEREGEGG